jgi:hypothetical protein
VLLAEDEDAVRQFARRALQSAGYRVLVARDGPDAVGVAARHDGPIHALLTDVVMPGMSGPDLARQLASLRPEIRVLFMSGYTADEIGDHGELAPDTAFLQKPFSPEGLTAKIEELLRRREPA